MSPRLVCRLSRVSFPSRFSDLVGSYKLVVLTAELFGINRIQKSSVGRERHKNGLAISVVRSSNFNWPLVESKRYA